MNFLSSLFILSLCKVSWFKFDQNIPFFGVEHGSPARNNCRCPLDYPFYLYSPVLSGSRGTGGGARGPWLPLACKK